MQNFWLESPRGFKLAAVVHVPVGKTRTGVVVCHGMLSGKDSPKLTGIAERLCQQGHAVLRFDFSGRGQSQGDLMELTFRRQVEECRVAMAELRKRGFDRLGLIGSSMGGAVAILAAAAEKAAALVTLAAIGYADRLAERAVGQKGLAEWRRKGRIRLEENRVGWSLVEDSKSIDVQAAAQRIVCPWLILHGEDDEVIPVSEARVLQEASQGRAKLEVIPGADHKFSQDKHREHIIARAVDFLHGALFVSRVSRATSQDL